MKLKLLFLSLLIASTISCAHSDNAKQGAEKKPENEISKELFDDSPPAETKSGDSSSDDFAKANISSDEVRRLADAKKSRSEPAIVKAVSEILSKDPNNLLALNTLGVHYFEIKKYGLAKIIFRRALKTSPNEPALHNNLGIIYLAENELRLALESFKKSVEVKSSYKIGATNLSSIYLEYGDFNRSLAPLEEAYRATRSDLRRGDATSVEIANNYAVALMGVGEDGKAKGIYEDIYESNTRNPIPFLNYAILLVEVQKKKKDAVRVLSKLKFMTEDREILRRVDELEKKLE